jgi:hypothetical protein
MPDIHLVAVAVATIIAFIGSGAYYAVLGRELATVSQTAASGETPPSWTFPAELVRTLILVLIVAGLASQTGADTWPSGLLLGLVLWIGFPLMLWTGAMLHERTPLKLAAIHAGDWLIKLLLVTAIVGAWQ